MKWRVLKAEVSGAHSLDLTFKDGTRKRVDLLSLLEGPVFERLRDPKYFAKVQVDPVGGTVAWPNGADIAPETLYELASGRKETARNAKTKRRSPNNAVHRTGARVARSSR